MKTGLAGMLMVLCAVGAEKPYSSVRMESNARLYGRFSGEKKRIYKYFFETAVFLQKEFDKTREI